MEEEEPSAIGFKWGRLQQEADELFSSTLKENEMLKTELDELKQQMSAYKTAYKVATDKEESLKHEVTQLQAELALINDHDPLAVTLIDGDGYIFSLELIKDGKAGGQLAAAELGKALTAAAGKRLPIYAVIYLNRNGLCDLLYSNDIIAHKSDFDDFIVGFNQASPLLSIVDVGRGKEAADAKVREMLRLFANFLQVKEIYFGGIHDAGYRSALVSLQTQGLLHKVKLLSGASQTAQEIIQLGLPIITFDNVFTNEKLVMQTSNARKNPIWSPHFASRGLASPEPVVTSYQTGHIRDVSEPSQLDKTKTIAHRKPSPCIAFYLTQKKCSFGNKCRYSHEYILSQEEINQFRQETKQSICYKERSKGKCWDRDCPYGHDQAVRLVDDASNASGPSPVNPASSAHFPFGTLSETFLALSTSSTSIDPDEAVEQLTELSGYSSVVGTPGDKHTSALPVVNLTSSRSQPPTTVAPTNHVYRVNTKYDPTNTQLNGRDIDPKVSFLYQKPKPCQNYYLHPSGCRFGNTCKYAHDYHPTTLQLSGFRNSISKVKCPRVKGGGQRCSDPNCLHSCSRVLIPQGPSLESPGPNSNAEPSFPLAQMPDLGNTENGARQPQANEAKREALGNIFQSGDLETTTKSPNLGFDVDDWFNRGSSVVMSSPKKTA